MSNKRNVDVDVRDSLEVWTYLRGESNALEMVTEGMIKKDDIECCVCLNIQRGVKLPNCDHYLCIKCYYKIYNGFISEKFKYNNPKPKLLTKNLDYPYKNVNENEEIFNNITNDKTFLEWFINENEDLYNSIKMNSEFVEDVNNEIKIWFEKNENIKKYENDLIKYNDDNIKYDKDLNDYNILYDDEKEYNSQKICPLCRL